MIDYHPGTITLNAEYTGFYYDMYITNIYKFDDMFVNILQYDPQENSFSYFRTQFKRIMYNVVHVVIL